MRANLVEHIVGVSVCPLEVERPAEASAAGGASLAHPLAVDEEPGCGVCRPTLPTRPAIDRSIDDCMGITHALHHDSHATPTLHHSAMLGPS